MRVSVLVAAFWLAASPSGTPAFAGMDTTELLRRPDSMEISVVGAEPTHARLGEDVLPGRPTGTESLPAMRSGDKASGRQVDDRSPKKQPKAQVELKSLAVSMGRGKTNVPPVAGMCVDKTGKKVPCDSLGKGKEYGPKISGDCGCNDKVVKATKDLRTHVLGMASGGGGTGDEYFDKFFMFLIEQYTETGKGEKLPQLVLGTPNTAGDLGSYTPGSGIVTMGPAFCAQSAEMRRRLVGHGYFHRWDDGLDGDPLPPNERAESMAFAVMDLL